MNIGDYVRIDGYISKIGNIRKSSSGKTYVQWKQPNGLLASGNINVIEKSSHNITDLIEENDYVNGSKVTFVDKELKCVIVSCSFCESALIYEKDIKSIVTKEQFEKMEYKMGE